MWHEGTRVWVPAVKMKIRWDWTGQGKTGVTEQNRTGWNQTDRIKQDKMGQL